MIEKLYNIYLQIHIRDIPKRFNYEYICQIILIKLKFSTTGIRISKTIIL